MIIIVSGLPRSGTSLMMKMLESGGLELLTDNIRKPDEDNPKGYYEYERVKNLYNGDVSWIEKIDNKVIKIISYLLKYLPTSVNFQVIFMERNIDEIIESQNKMIKRRGEHVSPENNEKIKVYLVNHLKRVKEWLDKQSNFDVLYINYNKLIEEPENCVLQIKEFINLDLNIYNMINSVDKKLYRNRKI